MALRRVAVSAVLLAAAAAVASADYSSPTYSRSACSAAVGYGFVRSWVGDGFCDNPSYNKAACDWDGGDCCEDTCVNAGYSCGVVGYSCLNPAAGACPSTCEGPYSCDEYQATGVSQTCEYLESEFGCNCAGCDCLPPPEPCNDYLGFDCSPYGAPGDFSDNLNCFAPDGDGLLPQLEACCTCKGVFGRTHDYLVPWSYPNMQEITGPSSSVSQSSSSSYFQTGYDYPSLDDACQLVDYDATIFGLSYSNVWICANGVLSFGEAELAYTPIPIPYSTFPMIAAFWADVDVRCGSGSSLNRIGGCGPNGGNNFGYAIVRADDASDPEGQLYVASVGHHIRALYKPDFTATSILATTWHEVGYYSFQTDKLNSFQVVLATDAVSTGESYACLYFKDIEWSLGQVSGSTHAQVGFDKGDFTTYYAHPDSTTASIADIGSDGEPICYRIDTGEICGPGEVYVDVATGCVPQGCNVNSAAGAFADAYLQPSSAGGCDFDLADGESCALTCVQGRIADAGAAMTTTCSAGVLLDPGPQCVSPGITVTPTELDLVEGGAGAAFYIQALTPVYDAPVTVHLTASDGSAITLKNAAGAAVSYVQFTAENWNAYQTITVAATQNTRVAAAPVAVTVSFTVASLNSAYTSLSLNSVTVNIEDDDVAGINVDTTGSLSVSEADSALDACDRSNGATTTIRYSLDSEPSGVVQLTFGVGGSNPELGQICDSSRLVFTTTNWATPQSLVVAAVGTDVDEGVGKSFTISGSVGTDDPNYAAQAIAVVSVGYNDDDVAGMSFLADGVRQVQEGGAPVVFGMNMDSRPAAAVTFSVTVDDTDHCTLVGASGDGGSLSIDVAPSMWSSPVAFSVAAVDDDVIEAMAECTVTVATTSADPNYNGLSASAIVQKFETDVAEFALGLPASGYLAVAEGGASTLSAVLSATPTAPVTVAGAITSWDASIGDAPVITSAVINPAAWSSTTNRLQVACAENLIHENTDPAVVSATLFEFVVTTSSADPNFDGLPAVTVTGFCEDNDMSGVTVGAAGTACNCGAFSGGAAAADTVLCSADVGGTLTCSPPDSTTGQCAGGEVTCAASASGVEGRSVTNVVLAEDGDAQSFTLHLLSVPTAAVTFSCVSSDPGRVAVAMAQATLTPTGSSQLTDMVLWLDVAAVADDVDHPTQDFSVTCSLSSGDANYDGLSRVFLRGAVTDDDVAGVTHSPLSATTSESDTTANPTTSTAVSVVLDSEPTEDVVVTASLSAGAPAGFVGGSALTFTAADWDTAQSVELQGTDDDVAQTGPTAYTLTFAVTSSDSTYDGQADISVAMQNLNDDFAGLAVSTSSELTSEDPDSPFNPAVYSVVLESEPLADVVVSCASSDTGVGVCASGDLTFTSANWDAPQTFDVVGVDNDVAGDDADYSITVAAASSDAGYDGQSSSYAMSNLNDDVAGVSVTSSTALVTSEDASVAAVPVCVALESQPLAGAVTITLSSSDTTEALIEGAATAPLAFDAENWAEAQCVDVSGQHDYMQDGAVAFAVAFDVAAPADASYDGIVVPALAFQNLDIDVAGYIIIDTAVIDPSANERRRLFEVGQTEPQLTSESGLALEIDIVLTSLPAADVVICGESSDESEGTFPQADGACLTFTPATWDTPQALTLSGVDDDTVDGPVPYNATLFVSDTTDANYNTLAPKILFPVTNLDNDVAGVAVARTGFETSEAGAAQTISLTLDSRPYAAVTIAVASDDTTEGSVAPASVVIAPEDWADVHVVTVTGVNDNVDDGNQAYGVGFSVTSADGDYDGLALATLAFENTDDDTAEVLASAVGTQTYESGQGVVTVSVTLGTEPAQAVTVTAAVSDGTEAVVTPSQLSFVAGDYSVAQVFTVSGVKDYMVDGNIGYTLTLSSASSTDTTYAAASDIGFALTNVDEDEAGLLVSETSLTVTESGGTASFAVKLRSMPADDVTITAASDDSGEGTVTTGASLTFTAANWNTTQTVVVTGADDDVADGEQEFAVSLVAASSDADYDAGAVDAAVAVFCEDDDLASLVFSTCKGSAPVVGEGSTATACFQAALSSEPYDSNDVTVTLTADATEGALAPVQLTFNSTNWDEAQETLLSSVDDDFQDGSQTYCVMAATASADPAYDGLRHCISATTTDDDQAALVVSPTSEFVAIGEGGVGNFSLVLESEPENGDVTVVAVVPEGTATLTESTFTFTSADWDVPQHCFYTANEDDTVSGFGELDFTIAFSVDTSVDPVYAALDGVVVSVAVLENDVAGVSASATSVFTAEGSAAVHAVSVQLASVPDGTDVVVSCACSDTTEALVAPSQLTFDSMVSQELFVVSVDDDVADGAQPYLIECTVASADANYDGLFAFNVTGTNADDDFAELDVTNTGTGTSENGAVQTFTVRLTSEPVDDVAVAAASTNTAEGVAAPAALAFTAADWNVSQTVVVTGQNDCVVDGAVAYNVSFTASSGGDALYAALAPAVQQMTNADNDRMAVELASAASSGGTRTTEAGGCVELTLLLTARPYGAVTVTLSSSDAAEGAVLNGTGPAAFGTMVLDPAEYACRNGTLTFTACGVDDDLDDGDVPYTLTAECVSVADARDASLVGAAASLAMVNEDDDASGVGLSSSDSASVPLAGVLTTDENGEPSDAAPGDLFLRLASEPYADVTATVTCNDTSEMVVRTTAGSFSGSAVYTFTASTWDTPQRVVYQGVDDDLVDGPQPSACTVTLTSVDNQYAPLTAAFTGTNFDNDVAGAIATATSAPQTTEAGGSFDIDVVLTAEPFENVTVFAAVTDTDQATVSPASIEVAPADWATPVTFTVTGVDNNIVDGTVAYAVDFSTSSGDGNFDALAVASVAGETSDDDVGGFAATATGPETTAEPGITCCTSTTIDVALTAEPQGTVTVTACSTDLGGREGTLATDADPETQSACVDLVFTAGDWTEAQTLHVTGGNDDIDDGNQNYNVYFTAASSDPAFDDTTQVVALVNIDDDVAAVITQLPVAAARVYEGNATTYDYTLVLNSEPVDDVAVTLTSDDEAQVVLQDSVLTFTAADWDQPQTVRVSSVDNELDEGDVAANIVAAVTSATDTKYNGIGVADVPVLCVNDDVADVAVSLASGSPAVTAEDGTMVTLDVFLTAQPTGTVSLSVAVSDLTEARVVPGSTVVTFTPSDYSVPQQVVVSGVPDDMVDGSVPYDVTLEVSAGTYAHAGVPASAAYSLANSDIDVASLLVQAGGASTVSEDGTQTGYLFSLSSKPYAAVTVVAQVSNPAEVVASANGRTAAAVTISFSPTDWSTQKAIAFVGVDDDLADGPQQVAVSFTLQSEDGDYHGLAVTPVALVNNDNDVASVGVEAPFSVGVVSEAQAGVTFALALTSEPYADVVVSAASSDSGVGTVGGGGSFTFTAGNWSEPQNVRVTAVTTDTADRIVDFNVTMTVASLDAAYDGFELDAVLFEKIDLTTVGVVRTPSGATTYEDASRDAATISVAVLSQPHEDVVVSVASTDTAEGAVFPATLTFTAANWHEPQLVTVAGVDDDVDDVNALYNVTFAVASADPDYDAFRVADVPFVNVNDDHAGVASSVQGSTVLYEAVARNGLDYGGEPQPALCVVLETEPVAAVTATVANSAPAQARVGAAALQFTAADWATPQCVTVDPRDDFVADGDAALNVTVTFTSAGDPNYDGVAAQDVLQGYEVVDDDHTGITVSSTSFSIVEDETAPLSVVLDSEPIAEVRVFLTPSDASEVGAAPASLTFTAANWNVSQSATLSAVHDFVDDGDVLSAVAVEAVSTDQGYAGLGLNLTVLTVDIDVRGLVTVPPTSGLQDVSEEGDEEQFGLRLQSKPLATVTLELSTTDDTECALEATTVVITPEDWASGAQVNVIGLDDLIYDLDQPCGIVVDSISSADPMYHTLDVAGDEVISFTNIDDDEAGIVCVPLAHTTSEATLAPATSVITLKSQPMEPVSISYASSDETEGVATGTVVLTQVNWFSGVPVVIQPVDDDVADGPQTYTVDFGAAVSAGADYSGMVPEFVISVVNLDNNTAGMELRLPSATDNKRGRRRLDEGDVGAYAAASCSEENATSFEIGLRLTSRPYSGVRFVVDPPADALSRAAALLVMPALAQNVSVDITPDQWSDWQTVELACEQDDMATGDFSFDITWSIVSDDPAYAYLVQAGALDPPGMTVTVEDADAAGVAVALGAGGDEDRLETNSTGRSDVMSVWLTSRPFHDVEVTLLSKAPAEGTLSTSALTFTNADWDVPQTVAVVGADGGAEAAQLYDLQLTVEPLEGRQDFAFVGLTVAPVKVLNLYPVVVQQQGFTSFTEFANSPTGLWVWIAIAIALLILVILVVVIVVNRHRHKKEIEKERMAAVAARESMLAGADEVNDSITWAGGDDDGIEMGNVDSIRTYEREYDGIVKKLQREAQRLKATNESLASDAGAEPLALHGAESSSDVMQLFSIIRELKAANSDLETRGPADNAQLLKKPKKKKKQVVFGQSQI